MSSHEQLDVLFVVAMGLLERPARHRHCPRMSRNSVGKQLPPRAGSFMARLRLNKIDDCAKHVLRSLQKSAVHSNLICGEAHYHSSVLREPYVEPSVEP